MNAIRINGVSITGGRVIQVTGGRVIVDGQDVTPESKEIKIEVQGNLDRLEADVCSGISITGNVGNVKTQSGDVNVGGNIDGSVQTMSGDVDCDGEIRGGVSTMSGDIKHRSPRQG